MISIDIPVKDGMRNIPNYELYIIDLANLEKSGYNIQKITTEDISFDALTKIISILLKRYGIKEEDLFMTTAKNVNIYAEILKQILEDAFGDIPQDDKGTSSGGE